MLSLVFRCLKLRPPLVLVRFYTRGYQNLSIVIHFVTIYAIIIDCGTNPNASIPSTAKAFGTAF